MADRKRVAFVACRHTLTGSPDRWPDAYEHDRERDAFMPAFQAAGLDLVELDWEQSDPARDDIDLYFIRTTWNYKEKPEAFAAFIRQAAGHAPVMNDPATILWNMNKRYLGELEARGLPVIPSVFIDHDGVTVDDVRARIGADEIVLKPLVGGGGFDMRRVLADEPGHDIIPVSQFAQPFLPGILDQGEISFVFVEDRFSHALRKLPAEGNYLIHTHHGGRNEVYEPTATDLETCRAFLDVLPAPALATRIDVVPHRGQLLLMELEAIEAHLFPEYNPKIGRLLAEACQRLIAAA